MHKSLAEGSPHKQEMRHNETKTSRVFIPRLLLIDSCSPVLCLQLEESRSAETSRVAAEGEKRLQELDAQVAQYKGEVSKCQAEVDRLLLILKQSETDKQELEAQVKDLQE